MKKLALGGAVALCLAFAQPSLAISLNDDPTEFDHLPRNFDVVDVSVLEAHEIWIAKKAFLGLSGPESDKRLDYLNALASRSGDYGGINESIVHSAAATIEFIYLGSEAKYGNSAHFGETKLFGNDFSSFGDRTEVSWTGGKLDFRFCTDRGTDEVLDDGCISNDPDKNSGAATELEIAVSRIFQVDGRNAAIFFFGDGAKSNDSDLDDMVIAARIVSSVPLPAGALLLGSVVLGLGGLNARRRRMMT